MDDKSDETVGRSKGQNKNSSDLQIIIGFAAIIGIPAAFLFLIIWWSDQVWKSRTPAEKALYLKAYDEANQYQLDP